MKRRRLWLGFAFGIAVSMPARSQVAPILRPAIPVTDLALDSFYAARPGTTVWLRDAASRAAAAKLPALLRAASIAGLSEGPQLASGVEAAIARGQPEDDRIISVAWVKYVRALKGPVAGVNYGDPALALQPQKADIILSEATRASSLSAFVDSMAATNSFYAALRDTAERQGAGQDPRVRATLDRLRLIPATGRAIMVDVASARLWMLEDGRPVDSMKVIVGKTKSQTPLLAGTIHYVTFNPYWHILDEVARNKVAPLVLKRGTAYLKAARYDTVSSWTDPQPLDPATVDWKGVAAGTEQAFIRQKPGANNMMGAMKFSFENDQDIFLHDTPHKGLFAKDKRTLSLGCVRLEHADRLAKWLLGRDAAPPSDAPELHVQVEKGVPVYITYLTARADEGQLAFPDDVYGLDPKPELAGQAPIAN